MEKSRKLSLHIKYLIDKLIALVGVAITSPIFLVVGAILKFQGEDIFYFQNRAGYLGEEFEVIKFTTMPKGSEKLGLITTTNDPRPTKLGMFLRKTKINELPQLINVLKGDMSVIGPRPIIKSQLLESLTEEEIRQYYQMRPGITGLASLHFHHEDKLLAKAENPRQYFNTVLMPQKKDLEIQYAREWNLFYDLRILYLTMRSLIWEAVKISNK